MKTTLPAVLFIFGLIGLTGMSTAKAADKVVQPPERFSALCLTFKRVVVDEDSVEIVYRHPDNRFVELRTLDNRKIITAAECTFIQKIPSDAMTSIDKSKDKSFPQDGEPRYAIGY
jgi:hypothetical protein